MPFFMHTNIGEHDEQTILKLELALFFLKRNVSTKNWHTKSHLYTGILKLLFVHF
jgi:hypothetical protein